MTSALPTFSADAPAALGASIPSLTSVPPPVLPAPQPIVPQQLSQLQEPRVSLRVKRAPVQAVLHTLARKTKRSLTWLADDQDAQQVLTLSLHQATLSEALGIIARATDLVIETQQQRIVARSDQPYLRVYRVDYLNMQRQLQSQIDLSTQIDTLAIGRDGATASRSNNSWASVRSDSEHQFWQRLHDSLERLLPEAERERFSINPEASTLQLMAKHASHQAVEQLIRALRNQLQRQVMIEATVVEVTLSQDHQSGVDWRRLNLGEGLSVVQLLLPNGETANAQTAPVNAVLSYQNQVGDQRQFDLTIKALDRFGDVNVLSTPKIIALNNQPALLKVVDNRVYFTSRVDRDYTDTGEVQREVWETRVNTVPVGLVMSVLPYISEERKVLLTVRPTLSRILGFVNDPNPALQTGGSGVVSAIPELQVREMESVLRLSSGQTAVIGGLMQSSRQQDRAEIPLLGRLPVVGRLFGARSERVRKTELLIFLKPTVLDIAATG